MKTVIGDVNLLFFRYVVYEHNNQLQELICLQWPWTTLRSLIGDYTTLDQMQHLLSCGSEEPGPNRPAPTKKE